MNVTSVPSFCASLIRVAHSRSKSTPALGAVVGMGTGSRRTTPDVGVGVATVLLGTTVGVGTNVGMGVGAGEAAPGPPAATVGVGANVGVGVGADAARPVGDVYPSASYLRRKASFPPALRSPGKAPSVLPATWAFPWESTATPRGKSPAVEPN